MEQTPSTRCKMSSSSSTASLSVLRRRRVVGMVDPGESAFLGGVRFRLDGLPARPAGAPRGRGRSTTELRSRRLAGGPLPGRWVRVREATVRMAVRLLLWAVLATLLPDSVAAWRSPPPPTLDRRAAASGVAAALLLPLTARPASAGDGKDDKAFQKCLSQCVYEKTKITKGIAQVRARVRPHPIPPLSVNATLWSWAGRGRRQNGGLRGVQAKGACNASSRPVGCECNALHESQAPPRACSPSALVDRA